MPARHPFLLDPDVIFLNHGSFGATPAPVFDEYQRLQLEMERQPVRWMQREADQRLAAARAALADYVGCDHDELVYFPNPTQAINMVARAVGADFYTGAPHKWLCAPKGTSFLYAHRDAQHLLKPLVVSWGWESLTPSGSTFVDHHEWQGTRDLAPFLATPVAIEWTRAIDWEGQQQRSHDMVRTAIGRVDALTGLGSIYPDDGFHWYGQMAVALLPDVDVAELKRRLYDEFLVELPVHRFADQAMLRVSIAAYTVESDIDALIDALATLLPQLAA